MVAELLLTNLETESEIDDHDKGDGSSALPVRQDLFMQASRPKTKSVSVTVHVKGKDKDNLGACMIPYWFNIMHTTYAVTETEKPPEQTTVGIQCDLLAAPPLQKLVPMHHSHHWMTHSLQKRQPQTWTHHLHAVSN